MTLSIILMPSQIIIKMKMMIKVKVKVEVTMKERLQSEVMMNKREGGDMISKIVHMFKICLWN